MIKFKALSENEQKIYDLIKKNERNVIKKNLGVTDGGNELTPFEKLYQKFIDGKVKNFTQLEGYAFAMELTPDQLKARIYRKLQKESKSTYFSDYYYDKKAKKEEKAIELFN
jgi:hypothetical protein